MGPPGSLLVWVLRRAAGPHAQLLSRSEVLVPHPRSCGRGTLVLLESRGG